MSYCTYGYMTCEPFVYWGDLHTEWAEFVRKVDVCDYLGKFRYINDAIEYFNELERLGGLDRDMDILRSKSYGKKGDIIRAISENSRIYGEFNN